MPPVSLPSITLPPSNDNPRADIVSNGRNSSEKRFAQLMLRSFAEMRERSCERADLIAR